MSRLSIVLFVAAAACGGTKASPTTVPLPPDKPAEPAPQPVAEVKQPPQEPPQALPPVEITLPASKVTVKLVSPGKGKREALRYTTKAGDKQQVELALDFAATQTETGKAPADQIVPTIVLAGEAETKSIDKDGNAAYALTVSSTDARDVKGSDLPAEKFKIVLSSLAGLVISSSVAKNGAAGDVAMKIEKPNEMTPGALELISMTLPQFPLLPAEPIAVGAKWQATTMAKLAGKLDVTQVTDYELVAHSGKTWTIKGTTKVTGTDQDVGGGAKITSIKGSGTSEATLADGTLYPTTKSSLATQFTASNPKEGEIQFALKVGGAVTPKK
ncbi:MAG: hypothetical protein H0T46_16605 [Deltaproteobacteria bacterium]|nr:hypothetical protein [Deltaproteobacteria bacterium]